MQGFAEAANASASSTAAAVKRLRAERDQARGELAAAEREATAARKRVRARGLFAPVAHIHQPFLQADALQGAVEEQGTSTGMVQLAQQSQIRELKDEVLDMKTDLSTAQSKLRLAPTPSPGQHSHSSRTIPWRRNVCG